MIAWIISVVLTHAIAFAAGAWFGGRRLRITTYEVVTGDRVRKEYHIEKPPSGS